MTHEGFIPTPPGHLFTDQISEIDAVSIRKRDRGGHKAQAAITIPLWWNPSGSGNLYGQFEMIRTPTWFEHVNQTGAGPTALHTPAPTKSFRLMGYSVAFGAGLAAAGLEELKFLDGATDLKVGITEYCPIAASVAQGEAVTVNLGGNGVLSGTVGNILNVTLSTAVTAGAVSITAWGCDE
jgi:hypothetical protein